MGDFPLVDAMYRDGFRCSRLQPRDGRDGGTARARLRHHARGVGRFALASQQAAEGGGERWAGSTTRSRRHVRRARRRTTIAADEHPRAGTTIEALRKLPPAFPEGRRAARASSRPARRPASPTAARRWCWRVAPPCAPRPPSARAAARLGHGGRRSGADGHRAGAGGPQAARSPAAGARRLRSRRAERSLRAAGARGAADLPIERDRLNVNGGAIALGHPIGCTGTRILVTLLHEMRRRRARRGLATLCVSGGLGMAMAVKS